MINDIIKNRYIVCQSPGHGKRIIDFFVKNGAVNYYNLGDGNRNGVIYHVTELGIIDCINRPKQYTEMQLPKEFTPKRGDVVEVSDDGVNWVEEIFLCEIEMCCHPFACVNHFQKELFSKGEKFNVANWKHIRPIQTITKTEAEKLLGKKIEG